MHQDMSPVSSQVVPPTVTGIANIFTHYDQATSVMNRDMFKLVFPAFQDIKSEKGDADISISNIAEICKLYQDKTYLKTIKGDFFQRYFKLVFPAFEDIKSEKGDADKNISNIAKICRLYEEATTKYHPKIQLLCKYMLATHEFLWEDLSNFNDSDTLIREFFQFNLRAELNKYPFIRKYEVTSTKFTVSFQSYEEFLFKSYEAYLSKGDLSKPYEEFFSKRVKFPTLSAKNLLAEGGDIPTLDEYQSVCHRLESWGRQISLALQKPSYPALGAYVAIDPIDRLNEQWQQILSFACADSATIADQKAANAIAESSDAESSDWDAANAIAADKAAHKTVWNSAKHRAKICKLYKQATYPPRIRLLCTHISERDEFLREDFSNFNDADTLVREFFQFNLRAKLNQYQFIRKYEVTSTKFTVSFQSYSEFCKSYIPSQGEQLLTQKEYQSLCGRLRSWGRQISLALQQETLDQVLDAYMAIDPIDRLDEALQQKLAVDSATAAAQTAAEFAATCAGSATAAAQMAAEFAATCAGSASVESEASASSGSESSESEDSSSEDSSSEDSDVEDSALNTHTVSTLLASQGSRFDAHITTADFVESEASEASGSESSDSESSDSDEDSESNVSASEDPESKASASEASASDEGPEHEDPESNVSASDEGSEYEDPESKASASEASGSESSESDEDPELGGFTASSSVAAQEGEIMSPTPTVSHLTLSSCGSPSARAKNKQKSPLAPDELWRNRFDSAPEPMSPVQMFPPR